MPPAYLFAAQTGALPPKGKASLEGGRQRTRLPLEGKLSAQPTDEVKPTVRTQQLKYTCYERTVKYERKTTYALHT